MFNIPCGRRGQFLSPRASYFKFKLNNTGGASSTLTLDYSAHALISRLEIYHGANLLEQISDYNVLAHILKDIQSGSDHQLCVGAALEGINSTGSRVGETINSGANRVFSIQLLSGIVGGLQEKYVPVGELAGDLRLELTLAGPNDPFVSPSGQTPSWTVDEMELLLEYVELSDTATAMIAQQNPNGFFLTFDSFGSYSATITVGATAINILIPARYSVLKTLLTSVRNDGNKGATLRTITDRENVFVTSSNFDNGEWYYSIGGKNLPATPVKTATEGYSEMMKSQHALGSVSAPTMLSTSSWRSRNNGTFIIAQDLEYLHGKSSRASNGVNTLSVNTHLIGRLGAATATNTHTVDTFAHYEGVLMVINGVAQVQM